MKTSINLFFSLMILMSTALFITAQAKDQNDASYATTEALSQNETDSQQPAQRGIYQNRASRLALQLDGLTEDQISRIDELNKEHRDLVTELLSQRQNNQITNADFMSRRRINNDRHQEQLKNVLTSAQWEQLLKIRADRRNVPANR